MEKLISEITGAFEEMAKLMESKKKVNHKRARKLSLTLDKLLKAYRKESVRADKE